MQRQLTAAANKAAPALFEQLGKAVDANGEDLVKKMKASDQLA